MFNTLRASCVPHACGITTRRPITSVPYLPFVPYDPFHSLDDGSAGFDPGAVNAICIYRDERPVIIPFPPQKCPVALLCATPIAP